MQRPKHSRHHPVHVTLRVREGLRSFRDSNVFRRVREALAAGCERPAFRLVYFSVQHNHLHLIVEAEDRVQLARGIQGLSVRIAKSVNRVLHRHGKVFGDRYHARALKTPRETRFALRYVLLNAKKHLAQAEKASAQRHRTSDGRPSRARASRGRACYGRPSRRSDERASQLHLSRQRPSQQRANSYQPTPNQSFPAGTIDSCSSAPWFDGWNRPQELAFSLDAASQSLEQAPVAEPRTWLLRVGWKQGGLLDVDDAPHPG